jgi:hypothetical protein
MKRNQEIRKIVEGKFFGNRVHQFKGATNTAVVVNAGRADRDVNVINIPNTGRKVRVMKSGKRRISYK